jgi:sugar transferase (PEP-CTERM/EpsH1 system associated)
MLTHRLPYPPDRGDRIRSYHMLRLLSSRFDVAVACTSDEPVWLQHHQLLSTMARRVAIQPISNRWSTLKSVRAVLAGKPATSASYYRTGLADQIRQWHEQQPFDAVLTYCTGMIEYARLLTGPGHPGPKPRHIIDLVDVDSAKWRSYARNTWAPKRWVYAAEARRLRHIEAGRFDHFDAVVVTTAAEAQLYRDQVADRDNLTVVANGVDMEYFNPLSDADNKTIVFVGVLNYRPNVDGITWFVDNVMPQLRLREPDAKLLIVGRHPTPRVRDLDSRPGVEVVGSVADVRHYLAESSAVIAPLLIARGVQNKVLEAMASARAVVCSPGAAGGIDAVADEHLLVGDEPTQWVEHLSRLLTDTAFRTRLAREARRCVEQRYNWQQCLEPMAALLNEHNGSGPAGDALAGNALAS